ncbi:MAG: WbqC family protein [Desulfuromonadaceae bacterium]
MRTGIIQSCYIPWRGFFDFIDNVELFILYDDVKYSHGSWRNRNQFRNASGLRWLTVPVMAGATDLPIDQVLIGKTVKPWDKLHHRLLKESLGTTPYFKDAMTLWEDGISANDMYLSNLNERLIRGICDYLHISTTIVRSRDYDCQGEKTARLINLLKKVGATAYLSGPAAKAYLDEDAFRQAGIGLYYKTYDYEPYPQQWGDFEGAVTVLDLIANCGPDARKHLKSKTPDEVVSP